MPTAQELVESYGKKAGVGFVQKGLEVKQVSRIPTTIFPLDYATGGGFPVGRISQVWGEKSGGKTLTVLLTIAEYQRANPDRPVVYIDVEHALDPVWASRLGVNCDELFIIRPSYAEEVLNAAEAFLLASDTGIVVIDSLAAMAPTAEMDGDADRNQVAGNSMLIGKLMRKCVVAINQAQQDQDISNTPTVLCINQVRYKVGKAAMFGDPKHYPGGMALEHALSLDLYIKSKGMPDKSINPDIPAFKATKAEIKKAKIPINRLTAEYDVSVLDNPNGLAVGKTKDWKSISNYLKDFDHLRSEKNKYILFGTPYDRLTDVEQEVYRDPAVLAEIKAMLIQSAVMSNHNISAEMV